MCLVPWALLRDSHKTDSLIGKCSFTIHKNIRDNSLFKGDSYHDSKDKDALCNKRLDEASHYFVDRLLFFPIPIVVLKGTHFLDK